MMNVVGFETDLLVLTKSGFAYGFEIKVSKQDLRNDFKKPQHTKLNGKTEMERYYGKFKYFSYATTEELKEEALKLIPEFCGLYIAHEKQDRHFISEVRKPKTLFNYKWSNEERYNLARLAAMRIYTLKCKIASLTRDKLSI